MAIQAKNADQDRAHGRSHKSRTYCDSIAAVAQRTKAAAKFEVTVDGAADDSEHFFGLIERQACKVA